MSLHPEAAAALARMRARATSTSTGCLVVDVRGYPELQWGPKKDGARMNASRAVLIEAGCDLSGGQVARHRCDNPQCIERSHLQPGTESENQSDAYRRGRRTGNLTPGYARSGRVLTDDQVVEIRRRGRAGESIYSMRDDYGVHHMTLWNAATGATHRHVLEPVVPLRRPRPSALDSRDDVRQARAMYAIEGMSLREIAEHFGVARRTAWRWCQAVSKRDEVAA